MRGKQARVLASAGLGLGWRVRADLVIDRGRARDWRPSTSITTEDLWHQDTDCSSPAANGHSIAIFRASGHVTSFHTPDPGPAPPCPVLHLFIVSDQFIHYTVRRSPR